MDIHGTYTFDAPVDAVWALLMDTTVIAGCVPGCRELRPIGDDRYHVDLALAVAAVTGQYEGTIALEDKKPPQSYRLVLEGTGRGGFVRGQATVALSEDGRQTIVDVTAHADVGGAVARIGQRLLEAAGRMMMDRFYGCLRTRIPTGT